MKVTFSMLATVAALSGLAMVTGPASAREYLYGSFAPATSNLNIQFVEPFLKEITEKTNGEVAFEFVPGGGVVDTKTAVAGLRDGVVDGATYSNVSFATELPIMFMFSELVGIGGVAQARGGAFMDYYVNNCEACNEEMEELNQIVLAPFALGNYNLFCTKEVSAPEDFNNLRVRAIAPWSRMFGALGDMVPVNVSLSEAYEALQRGAAECHSGPPNTYLAYSFIDVAPWFVETNHGAVVNAAAIALSRDVWDDFSSETKAIAARAAANAMANGVLAYESQDAAARQKAIDEGKNLGILNEASMAILDEWTKNNVAQVVARGQERGIENAQEIVDNYLTYLEKWQAMDVDFNDQDALAEIYWTEIFSKMKGVN
jgi:TRAP-type C4-dicarboxylate transport system substrate-binding protein